jgi:K+-transporting ATPase KdpF subunit
MEILIVMNASLVKADGPQGYLIGGIIAVFVLGYLVYTLIRPEKF